MPFIARHRNIEPTAAFEVEICEPTGSEPLVNRALLEVGDQVPYPLALVNPDDPMPAVLPAADACGDAVGVDPEVLAVTAQTSLPFFFTQTKPPGNCSPLVLHVVPGFGGPGTPWLAA
jgi:hypothetical protein